MNSSFVTESPGTLVLVVGPSGAGKDSLIAAARTKLQASGRFLFPRRVITRPVAGDVEDHVATDALSFARAERAGEFALSWHAHGLAYGIPASIASDLQRGRHAVINVSREMVDAARQKFASVRVIEVTASREIRAARLRKRGREGTADIVQRIKRDREADADVAIVNDGALEAAVAAFLVALSEVENPPVSP